MLPISVDGTVCSSQISRSQLRLLLLLHTQLWVGFPRNQTLRFVCRWFGGTGVLSDTAPMRAEGGKTRREGVEQLMQLQQ